MAFIIKKISISVLLFNVLSASSQVEVNSEHYILSVGQGECNTTISKIKKGVCELSVAVTADIGSSSSLTDPKYAERYNYDDFHPLFILKQNFQLPAKGIAKKKTT